MRAAHARVTHGWDLRSGAESHFPPVSSLSGFLSTTQLFINSENTPSPSQKNTGLLSHSE